MHTSFPIAMSCLNENANAVRRTNKNIQHNKIMNITIKNTFENLCIERR